MIRTLATAAALTMSVTLAMTTRPALAQDMQAADPAIDVNGDGYYSFPEAQVAWPALTETDFTGIDISGDGLLHMDEVAAAMPTGALTSREA